MAYMLRLDIVVDTEDHAEALEHRDRYGRLLMCDESVVGVHAHEPREWHPHGWAPAELKVNGRVVA